MEAEVKTSMWERMWTFFLAVSSLVGGFVFIWMGITLLPSHQKLMNSFLALLITYVVALGFLFLYFSFECFAFLWNPTPERKQRRDNAAVVLGMFVLVPILALFVWGFAKGVVR